MDRDIDEYKVGGWGKTNRELDIDQEVKIERDLGRYRGRHKEGEIERKSYKDI